MIPLNHSYAVPSFAIGSVAFAVLFVQSLTVTGSALRGKFLYGAIAVSLLWSLTGLAGTFWLLGGVWWVVGLLDVLRSALWLSVLTVIFRESVRASSLPASLLPGALRVLGVATIIVFAWLVWILFTELDAWSPDFASSRPFFGAWLGISIAGLAFVEQVYRNTPDAFRWAIKPFCIGLGGAFAYDLFCFSDAVLFSRVDPAKWSIRGFTYALIVPFVALSLVRAKGWKVTFAVSRHVAFHSTALLASGLYLLVVSAGGYYLREFGGEWAQFFQIAFVFGAVLVLIVLFWSGTMRSRIRVWVSKHFFSYRFDYREQWLNFTRALSDTRNELGIYDRSVKALADLVESTGGGLWLLRDGKWRQVARWSMPEFGGEVVAGSALPAFLASKGWVIDVAAARQGRQENGDVELPPWLLSLPEAWIVVPLIVSESELFGFVVLLTPRSGAELNWEVLDLLKTAGRQAASYLAQIEASEGLLEARKFDAFNRLSAFVVHDLKNLTAQLSLLLKNAERHWNKPEFKEDLLSTVDHVVKRMYDMLLQLRSGTVPVEKARLMDVNRVLGRVVQSKAAQRERIVIQADRELMVLGHEDRLERVIGHLVQNALEASDARTKVLVKALGEDSEVLIKVKDEGVGMTQEYIRDRLFKPFQSTKDAGMGIGTYESQQYLTSIGGRVLVDSVPGQGTVMTVVLPRAWQADNQRTVHE